MKKAHGILLMGLLSVGAASAFGLAKSNETVKADNAATEAVSLSKGKLALHRRAKTAEVSNLNELKEALKSADEGTIIYVKESIDISGSDPVTLDGNGCTISVEKPYINEDGSINNEASKVTPFYVNSNATLNLRNMTIIGGTTIYGSGAVYYGSGSKGSLENVTITRTNRGLYASYAKLILKNCNIVRNAAKNGGGLQAIGNGATVVLDGCSLSENYSTDSMGGGGALELTSGAKLFANNTIFTNNYSTEIGGAINVYSGYLYLLNSTLSGNVTSRSQNYGGGVGLNSGSAFSAINSIIDDNYYNNGTDRSDIGCYYIDDSSKANHELVNSVYGGITGSSSSKLSISNSKQDTTSSFGRKYRNDGIRKPDGYSENITHPVAATKEAGKAALYVPVSTTGAAASDGVKTYFNYSNLESVKIGYFNGAEIVSAAGLAAPSEDDEVTTFYESGARSTSVIGASGATDQDFYTVTLGASPEHGYIHGVSVYGDTYLGGTKIKLKGLADSGYGLSKFTLTSGSATDVTDNPYELTVNKDYSVSAIFLEGFPLTYDANGGTGDVPETLSFATGNSATVMANSETLVKGGYNFKEWNTEADGSGVKKNPGDKLVIDAAKTLYAQWEIKAAVQAVIDAISDIGTVEYTQDSSDKITLARKLYDALNEEDQAGVDNYSTLTDAEARYASLGKIKAVEDLITALGDVEISLDYDTALAEIATEYAKLSESEKAEVSNYSVFEEKLAAVTNVKDAIMKIDQIGEVSYPDSGSKIETAEEAYNDAGEYKNLVVNAAVLEAARAEFDSLARIDEVQTLIDSLGNIELSEEYDEKIATIKEKYSALLETEKAAVEGYDTVLAKEASVNKVKEVNGLISGLGDFEYSEAYETKLVTVNTKYGALSADEKALVVGYSDYQSKQTTYDHIDSVTKKIESIGDVSLNSEDAIKAAKEAYDALSEEEKALIPSYKETLDKADQSYTALVTKKQNGKTLGIVFGIIGGLLVLTAGAYFLLFFVFNKWIKEDDKAVRVLPFVLGEKEGKKRLFAFPFKVVYKAKAEIFNTKEEALK